MMYDTLLFLHFVGISIGAGTGVYMFALARHAARNLEQAEARTLMPGISGTVSRVGDIGLLLLLTSGIGIALIIGRGILSELFIVKMLLVAAIILFIVIMRHLARRAQIKADLKAVQWMRRLGILGPLLGVATILAAVLVFH